MFVFSTQVRVSPYIPKRGRDINGAPFESSWTLEFGVLNWNLLHHINSLSLSLSRSLCDTVLHTHDTYIHVRWYISSWKWWKLWFNSLTYSEGKSTFHVPDSLPDCMLVFTIYARLSGLLDHSPSRSRPPNMGPKLGFSFKSLVIIHVTSHHRKRVEICCHL